MIFTSAFTWFFLRTVPSSRNAKPACIASTITAPRRMNSVSVLVFKASMVPPDVAAGSAVGGRIPGAHFPGNGSLRWLGRRRVPLVLRDELALRGIAEIMRRHDLHAVLVEHVLDVAVQIREHLCPRPRLAGSPLADDAVLDKEIGQRGLEHVRRRNG